MLVQNKEVELDIHVIIWKVIKVLVKKQEKEIITV